jgi:DNA-binding transcriptional LysR family regulator
MELNQLDYFRTVARLENMTKAAEELYISQPNLSTSISRLESNLGIKLFQRSKGHIFLTDAGRKFLKHVDAVFAELENARFQIQEDQEYKMDSIAIGASVFGLLPALFRRYYQEYGLIPSTQLLLSNTEIERGLLSEELDIGVMTARTKRQELEQVSLGESPLVAVMRSTNPIQCGDRASIHWFKDAHYLCNTIYFSRELLCDLCAKTGFQPKIVRMCNEQEYFDEDSFDLGDNVSICPLHILPVLVQSETSSLRLVELADAHAHEELFLTRRKDAPRTAFVPEFFESAIDMITDYIKEQNHQGAQLLLKKG